MQEKVYVFRKEMLKYLSFTLKWLGGNVCVCVCVCVSDEREKTNMAKY